jgi:peptidoglycan hydrolase CwlO-like protein
MRHRRFSTALVVTLAFLVSHAVPANAAACSSSQLSSIRSAQNSLNMKQSTLSRAQADLAKVNQKLNTLQQQLNRYMSMKNGSSFVASTQRQITSALRDQGNAMSRVKTAQTFYDMSLRSYNSAAGRCTP